MLNKILSDYEPDYIAVAFDLKEKTFRHDAYPDYKAGRLATPIELLTEIPLLHQVLEAMNIKILELPKYEADDLIGTAARLASKSGLKTLVISGDKDELQLVDENVNVLINKKGMTEFDLYDLSAMKERYNLTPTQFIDLKGLMGDKSDNIPGVPGIGEKKGIALLEQYGSVEGVIDHADEVPGKMGEVLRANIDSAKMSKWLATINTEAPIEINFDECKYVEPDYKSLIEIYTELEFSSFIKKLDVPEEESIKADKDISTELDSIIETSFNEFVERVVNKSDVVIAIDSDDSHIDKPEIKEISLYSPEHNLYCSKEITALEIEIIITQLLEKNYSYIGYDLKSIMYSLLSYCDTLLVPKYDIQVAEYLIDSSRSNYYFSKMLLRYAGVTAKEEFDNKYYLFAINLIRENQCKVLEELNLEDLFYNCEMPLTYTLAKMELAGIKVDSNILNTIGEELENKISTLESEIYSYSNAKFNINSPKQLGQVLFETMAIPYPKAKTKTGTYSTAQDILDKLKFDYPVVEKVLEYRKVSKLKSTYVDGLIGLIANDGKIHPHFQQTVTATGRLSCTEPNLQNIPVRDDYGRLIRKAFIVSDENNTFTGADYSQIELRVLASLSGDEGLISAFKAGKDIHRATAARVFNLKEDEVTSLDRSKAKAVNFGVVYGMSGFGLSENLNITREESQKYINDYFDKHQKVKSYLDDLVKNAENDKLVRTHYGRLRMIPEFSSRKYMEREFAKRLAMNTPIQGTAADIIKSAMNSVSIELSKNNLQSKLILQIHDELIIEGPDNEAEEVKELLVKCMKEASNLVVELTCDVNSGKTWYELK